MIEFSTIIPIVSDDPLTFGLTVEIPSEKRCDAVKCFGVLGIK